MTQALTVAEVLERAADLLAHEGRWTQEAYGRDDSGCETLLVENAVCFCAMGAIYKARGDTGEFQHDGPLVKPLADVVERDFDGIGIDDWNDDPDRTQPEVVAKLREAAALARERGL